MGTPLGGLVPITAVTTLERVPTGGGPRSALGGPPSPRRRGREGKLEVGLVMVLLHATTSYAGDLRCHFGS